MPINCLRVRSQLVSGSAIAHLPPGIFTCRSITIVFPHFEP
ncbi:hypothetical protein QT986_21075 [Microcoleus sp. herbarium14]